MTISAAGLALIKHFESCRLEAYRDPVGIWTIGYGHTGADVHDGLQITQEQADGLLIKDLASTESALGSAVKVPLNQGQFDALTSWTFNCGIGNLTMSTLLRCVNAGKFGQASGQFLLWIHAGGKVLRGLVARRNAERALFDGKGFAVKG